jgi:Nucleotidyl transferase AbiEii toxin, Type IV TA system
VVVYSNSFVYLPRMESSTSCCEKFFSVQFKVTIHNTKNTSLPGLIKVSGGGVFLLIHHWKMRLCRIATITKVIVSDFKKRDRKAERKNRVFQGQDRKIEKDYQLARVLGLINGKKLPLVFKGGTALYKIYFQEPPRISVDLDFNSSTELLELSKEIKGLLEPEGFTLKKQLLGFTAK